ncbi:hypothetical protein QYF61_010637 [Mycteria americana]|uniref:Uncharacterized protein n=1 Tax=Mycteria americana TaxID=33587 RepID=A0AAN7S341_MYCAM|nr:hypothetical protein QYF61_010637 [Mycteria americana]
MVGLDDLKGLFQPIRFCDSVTLDCTVPLAAAINDPCPCGRQEQQKRLLLYKYLLPFLWWVSQLNYKCVGCLEEVEEILYLHSQKSRAITIDTAEEDLEYVSEEQPRAGRKLMGKNWRLRQQREPCGWCLLQAARSRGT